MTSDREIYEEVRSDLLRFAAVLVGPDDAPDAVSTVITRTLSRHGTLVGLENPKQYLMKAISNESRSVGRKRLGATSARHRMGKNHDVTDIADGRYPDVTEAVFRLPSRQRAAMYLVYWVGMSGADAARVLDCRPATLRRYLSLAREKLKGQFDG
jgi:RNA polymerase sigma-70 factor (ECF subfamily)